MSFNENWGEYTLKEIATLKRGYDLPKSKRFNGNFPILASNGIVGYHNQFKVEGPGVTTGRSGTLGKVFYIKDNFWPLNTSLYVKDFHGNDEGFIYYYLQTLDFKNYNGGSSVPTLNRNHIHTIRVKIPSLLEQKSISAILFSLDGKIELNNQINKNLEEITQAIFKYWFVDFEFPDENGESYKSNGGEMSNSELGAIPKEWVVIPFKEIIKISSGKRPKEKKNERNKKYNTPLIGASSVMGYVSEILYIKPILVIGRVGTHGIVQRIKEKSWPSDNTLVIQPEYYEYTYQILKNINYQSLNRGSTQPLITQTDIKKYKIIFPKNNLLRDFEKRIGCLFRLINKNKEENKLLSRIRDGLISKLMSGEIRLPINIKEGDEKLCKK